MFRLCNSNHQRKCLAKKKKELVVFVKRKTYFSLLPVWDSPHNAVGLGSIDLGSKDRPPMDASSDNSLFTNAGSMCGLETQNCLSSSVEQHIQTLLHSQRHHKPKDVPNVSRTTMKPSELQGFEGLLCRHCATGEQTCHGSLSNSLVEHPNFLTTKPP